MHPRGYYNELDMRKRQIDTLKVFNDHVIEVRENSEYRVDFAVHGRNMSLNVVLSPDFPNEKPSIFVNPPIQHSWLAENTNQIVGAPGLMNYTLHSDIGRVVQAIIREFKKSIPNVPCDESTSNETSPQSHFSGQSLMFPDLNELTIEELQEVLENVDLQDKILETNPQLVEFEQETEELMSSIENIAQDNLSKQQNLDDIKTEVVDKISTIVQMKMNFEELSKKYQKLSEVYDPHRIRDCLKEAAMKADEDAEGIAEQFLSGSMSVDTFVSKFSEKRTLGGARRARQERLAHQLAQLESRQ